MLERTLVKSLGWPEGRLLVLAHEAGTRLAEMGLSGEAILVWLDQVYAEPEKFVNDPALSRLALALLCPHHEKDVNRAKQFLSRRAIAGGTAPGAYSSPGSRSSNDTPGHTRACRASPS